MSKTLGALHFYPEDKDPSVYLTFKLYEGENTVGSSPDCDVQLSYPDISDKHLNITLTTELEYSFEDLGSKQGVFKTIGEKSRQQLKPGKEYELVANKAFYISNRYKCIFEAYENSEAGIDDFDHIDTLQMSNNGDEEQEIDHPTIMLMESTQIIPSIPPMSIDDEEEEEGSDMIYTQKEPPKTKNFKAKSLNSSQKEKVIVSPVAASQDLKLVEKKVERKKSDNEKKQPSQTFLKPEVKELKPLSQTRKPEKKEEKEKETTKNKKITTARKLKIDEEESDGETHYEDKTEPVVVAVKNNAKKNTKNEVLSSSQLMNSLMNSKKSTKTEKPKSAPPVKEPKTTNNKSKAKKEEKIVPKPVVEKKKEEEMPSMTRKSFKKANKVPFVQEKTETEIDEEEEEKSEETYKCSSESGTVVEEEEEEEEEDDDLKPGTPRFGSLEMSTEKERKNKNIIRETQKTYREQNNKSLKDLNPVSSSEEIFCFGEEGLVAVRKNKKPTTQMETESSEASLAEETSYYCTGDEIIPIKDKTTPKSSKTKMEEEDSEDNGVSQELSGKKAKRSVNGKRSSDEDSLDEYELASKISKKFKSEGNEKDERILPAVPPTSVNKSGKSTLKKESLVKAELADEVKANKKKQKKKEKSENTVTSSKRKICQVMFSGIEPSSKFKKDQQNLVKLGAKIIDDRDKEFTTLVMNDFKRTIKFLLALSKGVDIVNYDWVTDCIKQKELLPTDEYIYKDKAAEAKYRFNLASSLEDAKNRMIGLLSKYTVYISPQIKPSFEEVKSLVLSLEGSVVKSKPSKFVDNMLIILNEDDKNNIDYFNDLGFSPYTSELIYSAILQQKLSLENHRI